MATVTADARSLRGPGHPATPSREERLETAHGLLLEGLAQLTTSDAWTRMLHVAARFHNYSSGALRVFSGTEFTFSRNNARPTAGGMDGRPQRTGLPASGRNSCR